MAVSIFSNTIETSKAPSSNLLRALLIVAVSLAKNVFCLKPRRNLLPVRHDALLEFGIILQVP